MTLLVLLVELYVYDWAFQRWLKKYKVNNKGVFMTSDFIKQGEIIRAKDIIDAFDEKADQIYVDGNKAPINMIPNGITESDVIPANSSNTLVSILQTIINNLRWVFNNNLRNVANIMYPVGSIYMSVNSTNPGTLFGGTWVAWGQGRTIIGVGISDQPFNTVETTGGESNHTLTTAEMPSHNHSIEVLRYFNGTDGSVGYQIGIEQYSAGLGLLMDNRIQNSGNNQPHNNLPPYITCYLFKRTA
jgi:hypothetical protein